MRLVDRNVSEVQEADWAWAELVIISGMIVPKADMAVQIAAAKRRGLPVAVGGPFASSTPDAPELDLADFKILDEGEITLPLLHRGDRTGRTPGPLQLQWREARCHRHAGPPLRPARARRRRLHERAVLARLPVPV
jgi:radical SAM superfamily enzyme YgiQ (UPF0313 family)